MGIASTLGNYVYRASYDDLPKDVVEITKDRILDFLGTVFDSCWRYPMTPVTNILKKNNVLEEATVIGDGIKLSAGYAAMVNGAYNISDGYRFSGAHPACVIVPGALAVAEARSLKKPASGKELIQAVVLGFEVMLRIGQAMYPSCHAKGFSPTTVHGTMGVAAAAGKLMGLDKETISSAISIAALLSHGLQSADLAPYPVFSLQVGRGAETGILCAQVAQAGLKGNDQILEKGFIPAFCDEYRLDAISKGLGKDYTIAGTYIKMHGGCRHLHAPADAALYLRSKYNLDWRQIEHIKVKTYSTALAVCNIPKPQSGRQAEYTINFGVSVAFVYGDVSRDRFTDEVLFSKEVQELMGRITVEQDPELEKDYPRKRGTKVEVTTKDGKKYSYGVDIARGDPENPFSKAEIVDKFHVMASKVLDKKARTKLIDFINRLETIDDISKISPLLKANLAPGK